MTDTLNHLIDLLEQGITPFHTVEACTKQLLEAGFEEISYSEVWNLKKGGRYVMRHHGSALFAFAVGEDYEKGQMLRMAAAHTDYPTLRLKPNPDIVTKGYEQLNLEVYGGPILNTWFDRPLGVAGRVAVKAENAFQPELYYFDSKRAILSIPNLAIHMNREVNKGVELNAQVDLLPVLGAQGEEAAFMTYLTKELSELAGRTIEISDVLDYELNVYVTEKPELIGLHNDLLSAPRLDNLTSCEALVLALIQGKRATGINLIQLADHEEVGSTSKQGAASILLHDMARRILRGLGSNEEEVDAQLYDAMLVSADVAHAIHPNNLGKADPYVQPQPGKGFCIKEAASQSYATDSETIAIFAGICEQNQIPYQRFVNRSDLRGGSTLGAIASALTPVKTLDIGIPILAMHSSRELMSATDMDSLELAVEKYFAY